MRLALFDLDGTLRSVRPTSLDALVSYGAEVGLRFDAEARRAAIRWSHEYWAGDGQVKHDLDHFGPEEFMENYILLYLKALGAGDASEKAKSKIIARFHKEFSPEPYLVRGAKELLWGLREAGLTVGLVSNRDNPLTGMAIELGVIEHFNFTLAAGQVDSWKPDPGIFEQALQLGGGVAPKEAVYVGDNYYADVVGAHGVGMRAVLVDEEGAFPEAKDECWVVSQLSELSQYVPQKPVY